MLNYIWPSTKALDTKYNGKLEHLRTFLASVERRVDEFGWSNICMIGNRYLFREHGLITQQELKTAANSYATTPITRSAQNAQAMYEFLMNSVDQDLTAKLVNCTDLYKLRDPKGNKKKVSWLEDIKDKDKLHCKRTAKLQAKLAELSASTLADLLLNSDDE
jgi:hypothetical protein